MSNLIKNKKVRNGSIIAVLAVAALFIWMGTSPSSASETVETVQVVSLDLMETIETSGTLEAQPYAGLTWKTNGVVETVNVQPGDFVKKDDQLLTLDPVTTSASIVTAQADLVTTQENLEDLLSSGTDLAQAEIDLKDAQEDFDDAKYYLKYLQTDDKIPQTEYGADLIETNNGWKYAYTAENFKGPAPDDWILEAENDLALKEGLLQDAQREYDRLLQGEASPDVLAAQAKVDAAQTTVNSMSIIAPFDGEVLSVSHRPGDSVTTGELSVNLADLSHLYVEAQVDETDVARVKIGQSVEVTLDALPDVLLTGIVSSVDPVGQVVGGLVKYTIRVDLDKTDIEFLPLGSTANLTIKVQDAHSTLAVPIVAIRNDANGEYVMIVRDGETVRVDVLGGTITGDKVVVTGDVREGDTLEVSDRDSSTIPAFMSGGEK